MSTSLKTLIGKLDDTCRLAAERAASLCMARGNYEVDLEHLFLALLEQPRSDFALIAGRFGVGVDALQKDLETEIGRFRNGNTRTPVFSRHLPSLFEHAWLIASLDSHTTHIRSGHLLLAMLTEPDLSQLAYRGSQLFAAVKADELKHRFDELTAGSQEQGEAVENADEAGAAEGEESAPRAAPGAASRTPALDQYTQHLTQRARDGGLDPVIGREAEIRQVIDILMRRRQNNPILTGEAGVGKTAVVEGLALRIIEDDVPPPLQGVELYVLDMGLLQAGASVKGEFENRLKNVIEEVKRSSTPIILFIDEAHTMIGAGGQAGQSDAANLLKPALARGELRTIAATTWSEYKKYFEKDAALARRFQVVNVDEPDETLAAAMLRGMTPYMEAHFNVRIVDEAITEAARLSHRYISGRQLPDKAIGVLDTSCARVALAQSATPASIEDLRKRLDRIAAEITALERETASGANHDKRLAELRAERDAVEAERGESETRWHKEAELVARIGGMRAELEQGGASSVGAQAVAEKAPKRKQGGSKTQQKNKQKALDKALTELDKLQGDDPLIPIQVDGRTVAAIVASWTGIPLGRMVADDIRTVQTLGDTLGQRVIGQDHALEAVAQRVRTARASLEDPNKPQGVFLFVGPSGVGKTETALALADILYGGERKLITINMSEYQEAHTVSGLKGSPAGYVGYGEGGILTEAVRRSPYSVVLLDEVEKAHSDVLEMFYQVFDKGQMEDAEGRLIDFRNTLIILTSNVGSSVIMGACLNKTEEERPDPETLTEALNPALHKAFKPAFLGRLKTVAFYPINDDVLVEIIRLKLGRIADRVRENHGAEFSADDKLVEAVLARCTEVDSGARNVDHILSGTLLPEIAEAVLARMADSKAIKRIKVSAYKNGRFKYTIT